MADDRAAFPGEIGQSMTTFCDEHEAPFKAKRCNKYALMVLLMEAWMKRVELPAEETKPKHEDLANAVMRAMKPIPICCQLSAEERAKILDKVPPTTGSDALDDQFAQQMFKGKAGPARLYPRQPNTYTHSKEGGKDYYMMLGPLWKDMPKDDRDDAFSKATAPERGDWKPTDMIAMLSEGHPRHLRGPDDNCTLLRLERVASVKAARKWFERCLDEKAWLDDQGNINMSEKRKPS